MTSLTSARELAAQSIQKAQERYKRPYDRRVTYTTAPMRVGNWVLVHMPYEETGPQRKLSRPWYGPLRIISISDPDLMLTKVYFPQDRTIQVHQSRVKVCPPHFPGGFYWYGGRRHGPGRPPRWVSKVLDSHLSGQGGSASAHTSGVTDGPADGTSEESTQESIHPAATDPSTHDSTSSSAPRPARDTATTSSSAPRPACKYPFHGRRSGRT